jgi:acyl carrier protein
MHTEERLRQFIIGNFYVADPTLLQDDDSLLDAGIIDSTGVLELIGFLEREFGVAVADEEILPDNLDSIAKLTSFVARKFGPAQA